MMHRMNIQENRCPFGAMMITMKMGMSSTRMKRRYESTPMTKVEEEDEECI